LVCDVGVFDENVFRSSEERGGDEKRRGGFCFVFFLHLSLILALACLSFWFAFSFSLLTGQPSAQGVHQLVCYVGVFDAKVFRSSEERGEMRRGFCFLSALVSHCRSRLSLTLVYSLSSDRQASHRLKEFINWYVMWVGVMRMCLGAQRKEGEMRKERRFLFLFTCLSLSLSLVSHSGVFSYSFSRLIISLLCFCSRVFACVMHCDWPLIEGNFRREFHFLEKFIFLNKNFLEKFIFLNKLNA